MVKKIVVIGPESTGKSTLCQMLAEHYSTLWCPEYARQWLLDHGRHYTYPDLLSIAQGQLALEDAHSQQVLASGQSMLFLDTDMQVMKVWCEYVFNDCHTWILNRLAERPYDLYLLCRPDLPWVQDELREYPDERPRQELYHIYREMMTEQRVPWADISGDYDQRFQLAVQAVQQWVL